MGRKGLSAPDSNGRILESRCCAITSFLQLLEIADSVCDLEKPSLAVGKMRNKYMYNISITLCQCCANNDWVNFTTLKYFCIKHGEQMVFSICNHHGFDLSYLSPLHLNTYVNDGHYDLFHSFSVGIDIRRRQNLLSLDVRFWRLKWLYGSCLPWCLESICMSLTLSGYFPWLRWDPGK